VRRRRCDRSFCDVIHNVRDGGADHGATEDVQWIVDTGDATLADSKFNRLYTFNYQLLYLVKCDFVSFYKIDGLYRNVIK
jgi:hypothetical protein